MTPTAILRLVVLLLLGVVACGTAALASAALGTLLARGPATIRLAG